MGRRAPLWIVLAAAALAACAGASAPAGDGGPEDAGLAMDGGAPPDGGADGGTASDGGLSLDGGIAFDGGTGCAVPARDGGPTNPGWIGGPCGADADCAYDGGVCLTEGEGFPGGLCTVPCDRLCPDRTGPDDTVSFCVPGTGRLAGGGMCVARCDYDKEPLGCRTGYHCDTTARYNEASVIRSSCEAAPPECYQAASDACIDYRGAANPLSSPSNCPSELCDVRDAIYMGSFINGVVYVDWNGNARELFGSCELARALHRVGEILRQMGVVKVTHIGTYNCRQIAGTNCVLSQHALGLAIDWGSFTLSDGSVISVLDDWEPQNSVPIEPRADNPCRFDFTPATDKGKWLYDLAYRMCDAGIWSIILTPNYNSAHDNHFHLDLTAGYQHPFLGKPQRGGTYLGVNPSGD